MLLNEYVAGRLAHRRPLLMTHVVCGYPSFEDNWRELGIMASRGVDFVELQFPFSEPSADGPLFVKANQESLARGTTVTQCLEFMARVTQAFPFRVFMMGYYNTAFKMGHAEFVGQLARAGASGYILPDLPLEEAAPLHQLADAKGLAPIVLMTPTNTDARIALLADAARGFVYCVARRGVTGASTSMDEELAGFLARCRAATSLPLAVGFGVSTAEDLRFIGEHAEIAVIGTAALRAWEQGREAALERFFDTLGV
ncbi:MAG: tryptophan synthase subunit alpha [Gammaproteobacteria bacterium]